MTGITPTRATYKGHGHPETFLYQGMGQRPTEEAPLAQAKRYSTGVEIIAVATGQRIAAMGVATKFWAAPAPEMTEPVAVCLSMLTDGCPNTPVAGDILCQRHLDLEARDKALMESAPVKPTRAQANAIRWAAKLDATYPRGDVLDRTEAAGWVAAEDLGRADLTWYATMAGLLAIGRESDPEVIDRAHAEALIVNAKRYPVKPTPEREPTREEIIQEAMALTGESREVVESVAGAIDAMVEEAALVAADGPCPVSGGLRDRCTYGYGHPGPCSWVLSVENAHGEALTEDAARASNTDPGSVGTPVATSNTGRTPADRAQEEAVRSPPGRKPGTWSRSRTVRAGTWSARPTGARSRIRSRARLTRW